MGEKVLIDKEYFDKLKNLEDTNWKRHFMRTAATIREALAYGVLVPNNSDLNTVNRIETVNRVFNVINEICEEDHKEDPDFFPYGEEKKNITSPLQLVVNNKPIN
jgi:hypothetical protein